TSCGGIFSRGRLPWIIRRPCATGPLISMDGFISEPASGILAPHQPRPARDATHSLERRGAVVIRANLSGRLIGAASSQPIQNPVDPVGTELPKALVAARKAGAVVAVAQDSLDERRVARRDPLAQLRVRPRPLVRGLGRCGLDPLDDRLVA